MSPSDMNDIDQETRLEHRVVELHEDEEVDVEVTNEDDIEVASKNGVWDFFAS